MIQAIHNELPHSEHRGCYFHHTQSIIRWIQKHSLIQLYKDDRNVRTVVHQLMALGFLPIHRVKDAYNELLTAAPSELIGLFNYYKSYWIDNIGVELFNVNNREHRTNNAVESWHSRFKKIVIQKSPNIFELIHFLIQEQVGTEQTIGNLELGLKVADKKSQTTRLDSNIQRVKEQFNNGILSETAFLTAIGFFLHSDISVPNLSYEFYFNLYKV